MSIKGQTFTGSYAGGARVDFGVGTAGLDAVFASGYTIAVLAKTTSTNFGLIGAYSDSAATTPVRELFITNNSGGRLFGTSDFSSGFPQVGSTYPQDPDGISDGVWRWHVMSKQTGSAHYEMSYADLATLTWNHGEGSGAANHPDVATPALMFTTWSIYPLGFDAGDHAVTCIWPSYMDSADIEASCTLLAADLYNVVAPKGGWLFNEANSGSAIVDFTGGGADETSRQFIAASADPPGFSFLLTGEESLWLPTDGPGAGDFLDGSDGVPTIATGVSFTVTATGTISAVRFFATANAATGGGNYTVNLFEVTADDNTPASTLLGSSVSVPSTSIVSGAWNELPLTSPVTVQPGHLYRASLHSGTSGRYVATNNYFNFGTDHFSAGGHVRAWHNGDNPTGLGTANNGVFTIAADDPHMYPFHTTGANYWIDVVYKLGGGGAPAFDASRMLLFF